ncbi:M10 family metallopeptidase C-terminal domain-containing protein [Amaricoccus sp. W119]|uniref:M10 family metallopeptidase C-terminal domain-containing protein n=1 Tax=Amaricoccus sp. W119 TaxID=3391833 RepID=UPI0039A4E5DA
MARLTFLETFDIRDLPAAVPETRPGGGLSLVSGATALTLTGALAAYRPKLATAVPLEQGELTRGDALVVRVEEIGLAPVLLTGKTGAAFARELLSDDDRIIGARGDDRLLGFAGDDRVTGGRGADVMTGGGGADVFRFTALSDSVADNPDRITDFRSGRDMIDLRGIDAEHGVMGDQAFDFIAGAGFSGMAGELRWTGRALEADVTGDGVADFALRLGRAHMPEADDLLL